MASKKKPIIENDLVLVYIQHQPAFFARIEKIAPDTKKNWWQITLLILQLPVQQVTWILDDNQIREEDFTMGGIPVRIEKVIPPALEEKTPSKIKDMKTTPEKDKQESKPQKTRQSKTTQTAPARILTMNSKKSETND
ncbi:hypothetical protein JW964_14040 [candidate division KSB1 bacterium]|nr:hypothetical protein [candidate division KSB1 bacterium]